MTATRKVATELCLSCGLCCNGVLFKDVELQKGDNPGRLAALRLPLEGVARHRLEGKRGPKVKLSQPCAALCTGNLCRVYTDRPRRCREFECALFKKVRQDESELPAALRTIRFARQRADKVFRLLRDLGDTDEVLALSLRFKRTRRRMESGPANDSEIETFADLTLAVHELNVILSGEFYAGPGAS